MGKKLLLIFFAVILVAVVACGVAFGGDVRHGALESETSSFTVAAGDGTFAVAKNLAAQGAIAHPRIFTAYALCCGYDGRWQPGTFTLRKAMGYEQLCTTLTDPLYGKVKVTVPEGKQIRQIAKLLAQAGVCSEEDFRSAAAEKRDDYPFLAGIDHENPLEGYLFPDTYFFAENSDPEAVITAMLDAFAAELYTDEFRQGAQKLGLSFDELIILASIVESEATTDADRRDVAGVFLNRLNDPAYTKLQSCVTVEYALGIKKSIISYQDTQVDSPYNTYMYPGLPIGPICCPGVEAVRATIDHSDNDYYYFQSDKEGKLHFAATFAEHAAIQKELQADWQGEIIEDYNQ